MHRLSDVNPDTRMATCEACGPVSVRRHGGGWRCNAARREHDGSTARRLRAQAIVLDHLRLHSCADCGEADPVVLEFDHLGDKAHTVSWLVGKGRSRTAIEAEIAKCEVVCANCHRRRTYARGGCYRER
jgi:hypothetical protein